ncbi:hypothetical protein [Nocardia cyriacigeorgica]|jgi:hypothetical protein|uniref:hypothetical protein n=1 Tax=Nocardia cyriacigeorgica TaxID=135487 RepID=UPI0003062B29|nr:hypothetical protein [Nocardia cyriacigeorgica]MBF6326350.1 hypothetical protein [Nocardia cyriacigeorgica]MBF6499166.1 hypothetical protein [Nocardia cyriacigeorgica]
MTTWLEVLTALTTVPEVPLHGSVREVRTDGDAELAGFGWAAMSDQMLIPVGDGCQVWRRGERLRVEREDGGPIFITDGTRAWDFTVDAQRPRTGPLDRVHYLGPNQFLVQRRSAADWQGNDFTRPAGDVEEVEFAGRRCWTVELAPPPGKPHPLRIWVDVESGQMLGFHSEAAGRGARFVDLVVGADVHDDLFRWDGPVYTPQQYQQMLQDKHAAVQGEQAGWFADTVTSASLTARVPVDFTPESVPFRDPDTGAFDAHSRRTLLSRRPRTAEGWTPRWGPVHYVWSTPHWDWAAAVIDADLDDDAVTQLQQQLHPGEPVDRQRRVPGR